MADSVFISKIFEYSARKNRAKGPPAYSTLKPDTSSDSPSARSKGDRLVSARVAINHMAAKGQAGTINHIFSWVILKLSRVKPPVKIIRLSKMRAKITS